MTLEDYLNKTRNVNYNKIYRQIQDKVLKLNKLGICHNDLHVKNIMVRNGEWYLVDFGRSTYKNNYCRRDVDAVSSTLARILRQ